MCESSGGSRLEVHIYVTKGLVGSINLYREIIEVFVFRQKVWGRAGGNDVIL